MEESWNAIVGVAEKSGTLWPEVCFQERDKNGKPKVYDPFPEALAGEEGRVRGRVRRG